MKKNLILILVVGVVVLGIAAVIGASYVAARNTRAETWDLLRAAEADSDDPFAKMSGLDALREREEELAAWGEQGLPLSLKLFFDRDFVHAEVAKRRLAALDAFLAEPLRRDLEEKLRQHRGRPYEETYDALKLYLLLRSGPRDDLEGWMAVHLTLRRGQMLVSAVRVPPELTEKMLPQVSELVERWPGLGSPLDEKLVQSVRDDLSRVNASTRYYDTFITVLEPMKLDPGGPDTPSNRAYPAVSLQTIFAGRDAVTRVLSSDKAVRGPYTKLGFDEVGRRLAVAKHRVTREQWVLPLHPEEQRRPGVVVRAFERVMEDYEAQYVREWKALFSSIVFGSDQAALLKVLATPKQPYAILLDTLAKNIEGTSPVIQQQLASLAAFPVAEYAAVLAPVSAALDAGQTPDFATAERQTRELLLKLDAFGQEVMSPLLLLPLGVEVPNKK